MNLVFLENFNYNQSFILFISHEPRKKTLIPYIYNASNKDSF